MPVLDKNNPQEVARYQAFVTASPHRSVMQDMAWSKVKKDWGCEYVYLERDGALVAAMSLLLKKVPGGFTLLYAPRGPVCDFRDLALVQALVQEAAPVAKKHKAFLLKMDPETAYAEALDARYRQAGFRVRNTDVAMKDLIQPRNNMILYFEDHDPESIMMKYRSKTRNYIRSALRKGVTTTWGREDATLKTFYEIYRHMARRNQITAREYDYFVAMRDAYPSLRVYLARHESDILAAGLTINYHGKLYYLYAGSTDVKRNLNPNHLLNHAMIQWGIQEGGVQYDFGGVFEMDEQDGLYMFKKAFCEKDGVTTYIGEVDHVYRGGIYYLYNTVVPKVQQLKRKLLRRS